MIEDPVAPLFHNKLPEAVVDKVDEPQLFTTVTTGVAGAAFGEAVPEPGTLVQLPTVCVTLYDPPAVTVIEELLDPLLHNKLPEAVVDKVDEPQLSTTVTTGAAGAALGNAVPEPAELVQFPDV